jgi:hypothetical protein
MAMSALFIEGSGSWCELVDAAATIANRFRNSQHQYQFSRNQRFAFSYADDSETDLEVLDAQFGKCHCRTVFS